jgi:hypothetical protein
MNNKTFIVTVMTLSLLVTATVGVTAQVGRIGSPDGVREAIENKARELDLGRATSNIVEYTSFPGGIRASLQSYERGTVYYVPGYGVLWMSNAMTAAHRGDPFTRTTPELGFPISNEFRCLTPDARDRYQWFERGVIFWRAADNRYVVEQGAARPATVGDCARRPGPTATVVTGPQVPLGHKPPPRHRYRISILGFTANRQTADDPLQSDGKGDEVYVAVQVTKFQPNGEMISNTGGRSVLMGDTNLRPANEERQTAGNLSDDGGIGDGYSYMPAANRQGRYTKPTLPWVVYEGDLTTGFDALTVIPSIWEWDGVPSRFNWYQEWFFGLRPSGRPAFFYDPEPLNVPAGSPRAPGGGWIRQLVSDSVRSSNGISPTSVWGEGPIISFAAHPILVETNGDQPIGLNLQRPGEPSLRPFVPKILFLTDQLAQRAATTNLPLPAVTSSNGNTGTTVEQFGRLGPGVFPIRYSGTDERTGDYTLFLKVEQLP